MTSLRAPIRGPKQLRPRSLMLGGNRPMVPNRPASPMLPRPPQVQQQPSSTPQVQMPAPVAPAPVQAPIARPIAPVQSPIPAQTPQWNPSQSPNRNPNVVPMDPARLQAIKDSLPTQSSMAFHGGGRPIGASPSTSQIYDNVASKFSQEEQYRRRRQSQPGLTFEQFQAQQAAMKFR